MKSRVSRSGSRNLIQILVAIVCGTLITPAAGVRSAPNNPAPIVFAAQEAPRIPSDQLDSLVAPIALYPDPLLATMLPASVYPLEIVQAARFVADTNNLAKLDEQPWDDNVKAVARVPEAIKKLNEDIAWTMELGEAFLAQDKDIMDAIQSMRGKAQKAGTLQTSSQQVVTVTNKQEFSDAMKPVYVKFAKIAANRAAPRSGTRSHR